MDGYLLWTRHSAVTVVGSDYDLGPNPDILHENGLDGENMAGIEEPLRFGVELAAG